MTELTRRRFLEDSMLAAAAAVAAAPATKLLAEEAPSVGPNDKLNVACVGVRGRGTSHLGAFGGRAETMVTYICDPDRAVGEKRCAETAERQGGVKPKYVADMREAFEDPNVHIVSIATPNHWHALAAIWAMQHGKDVYVEKPVSHNVSEGRRMVEAARKYNKICQTGTQCRSMSANHEMVEFLKSGKIGDVKLARGLCYKGRGSIGPKGTYSVPASVNYDLWLGPAPTKPLARRQFHYDWHWFWDYGNGDLGNQGIHQMDIARWGLGVDNVGNSVVSYGGRIGYTDSGETANTQVSIHEFDGDKRLVFEVRGLKTDDLKGARVGVIFYGPEGYVVMTDYNAGAAFDPDGKMTRPFEGGGDHFGNFLKAVKSRNYQDLTADIEQGHLSSALCHLGNVSYLLGEQLPAVELKQRLGEDKEALETFARVEEHIAANGMKPEDVSLQYGAKLTVDPSAETIANNDQAKAMMSREYREPFVVPAAGQV